MKLFTIELFDEEIEKIESLVDMEIENEFDLEDSIRILLKKFIKNGGVKTWNHYTKKDPS